MQTQQMDPILPARPEELSLIGGTHYAASLKSRQAPILGIPSFPAILGTDTAFLRNPHYHQPSDMTHTLDLSFIENVCPGLVAAIGGIARADA